MPRWTKKFEFNKSEHVGPCIFYIECAALIYLKRQPNLSQPVGTSHALKLQYSWRYGYPILAVLLMLASVEVRPETDGQQFSQSDSLAYRACFSSVIMPVRLKAKWGKLHRHFRLCRAFVVSVKLCCRTFRLIFFLSENITQLTM
jgi:hypothetical protein